MKYFTPATIATLLFLLPYACGSPRQAPTVTEPEARPSAEAERGEVVFMNYCNACHPGGAAGLGPAILNKPLPGFMIRWQIRAGFGAMPAFKKEVIPPKELDELLAYIKAIR